MSDDYGPDRIDALGALAEQCGTAEAELYDGPESFLHLPYAEVDALVGGIGAGNVWFVGGFSGHGKTTFLMDLTAKLLQRKQRVYYLGTETRANEIRTRLACLRVGVYSGHVLSGKAYSWAHWDATRADLVKDIRAQQALGDGNEFMVCPVQRVGAGGVCGAFRDAAMFGADLLIIDHIDHIEHGAGRSGFEDSRMLSHLVLDQAQGAGLRTLVATQFNNESLRGNRLGPYLPPQPHYVYMGGHKRQVAWGMLGIYKPMRDNLTPEELKAARAGTMAPDEFIEPNVMALCVMKHRHLGSHEGKIAKLRFDHGRLHDIPERDRHSTSYEGLRRI